LHAELSPPAEPSDLPVSATIQQAYKLVEEIQQALQRSLPDVRSTPLGKRTLPEALARESERFAQDVGIECQFRYVGHLPPLRPAVAEYLLRIAQEALGQMRNDPTARCVTVELGHDGAVIFLQIAGDGAGFDHSGAAD